MFNKDSLEHIKYTWEHKLAFLKVEKQLLKKNTLCGYLHDVDKLIMYLFIDVKKAHNFHRNHSTHHSIKAKTRTHFIQMIIDWECARITKPDKPLDAYQTLYAFYPELEDKILPLLKEFGLARVTNF